MKELKKLVDECIRRYRKYYKTGDTDLLDGCYKSLYKIREVNEKVYRVINDCGIFYVGTIEITYKQIYHIIDYLCSTDLSNVED